jgi:GNAT superfamily N-acetyltransferase
MPITYQQEPLFKVIPEVSELLSLDWSEVGRFPLDPDWELYQVLEDNEALKIFTVRSDGKLVGYFSVVISPSLHSKGKFIVANDVIFLHPDHRKGLIGTKLFKFVERCLQDDGFEQLQVTYTERFDISSLLSRLGYIKVETKFEKRLN